MKFYLECDNNPKALEVCKEIIGNPYKTEDIEKAEVIVVVGGDGFMISTIHKYSDLNKPFYGCNAGTLGFLMNENFELLNHEGIEAIDSFMLEIETFTKSGKIVKARAINEAYLLRSTTQAAKIQVEIDGKVRLEELVCDGVLVATPLGSTAYNSSVHGPILPLKSEILALSPISPFRPKAWKGALLTSDSTIVLKVLEEEKRKVNAVADNYQVEDVKELKIKADLKKKFQIIFNKGCDLKERIIREQFNY